MTWTSEPAASRAYSGWQREKVEFLFGLSGRRAAMLGLAVLAVILPIATVRLSEGAVLWPAAIALTAAAFVRIGGRTADEWLIAAISYALLAFRGQHKFASGPFIPPRQQDGKHPDLPGILAPLTIVSVPSGRDRELGVAHHRYDRTWTAASAWLTASAATSESPGGAACSPACAPKASPSAESRRCSASSPKPAPRSAAGTPTTSPQTPRRQHATSPPRC